MAVLSNASSDARGALAEFVRLGFEPVAELINEAATSEAIRSLMGWRSSVPRTVSSCSLQATVTPRPRCSSMVAG